MTDARLATLSSFSVDALTTWRSVVPVVADVDVDVDVADDDVGIAADVFFNTL